MTGDGGGAHPALPKVGEEVASPIRKGVPVVSGRRRPLLREVWHYLGPAFLVSVGYMDPGNWGTDIEAGARFGYDLLWVILLSNLMAILIQSLSAKLGIATGRSLPENCRAHFPRALNVFLWVTAELSAMATDLAEFLGGALGFSLLLGIPLFPAALLTGIAVTLILALDRLGYRRVEYAIIGLVTVINLAFVVEVSLARPDWGAVAYHSVVPWVSSESILVVVGIVGATVMPHNVYLHSALVQSRLPGSLQGGRDRRRVFLFGLVDTVIALNMAWLVNAAILIMSAAVFYRHGLPVASIEEAHQTLRPLLGGVSSLVFAVGLLASGLASSTTATLAGQVILGGFLDVRLSIWFRRLLTMLPALVVIGLGMDPLRILILSQVSLSLQLPFAVVPLILFTRRRDIMGEYVNRALTTALAAAAGVIIIGLNGLLLYQLLGGRF